MSKGALKTFFPLIPRNVVLKIKKKCGMIQNYDKFHLKFMQEYFLCNIIYIFIQAFKPAIKLLWN